MEKLVKETRWAINAAGVLSVMVFLYVFLLFLTIDQPIDIDSIVRFIIELVVIIIGLSSLVYPSMRLNVLWVFQVAVLVCTVVLALFMASELSNRVTLRTAFETRISDLTFELAQEVDAGKRGKIQSNLSVAHEWLSLVNRLEKISRSAEDSTKCLIYKSLPTADFVSEGECSFNPGAYSAEYKFPNPEAFEKVPYVVVAPSSVILGLFGNPFPYFQKLQNLGSALVMAILVISCAVAGTITAGLRERAPATVRQIALGVATGFIVYLSLQGGKGVFLLQTQNGPFPFDPYSSGLFALIAGLFSNTAYELLKDIVNHMATTLRAGVGGGAPNATGTTDGPQKSPAKKFPAKKAPAKKTPTKKSVLTS